MVKMFHKPMIGFCNLLVLLFVFVIVGSVYAVTITNYCDVDDFELQVRAPNGTTRTITGFAFDSESGGCTAASPRIERWLKDDGYNWCPAEGDYEARTRAHSQQSTGNYDWDSWSDWRNVYTVDFDSAKEWCNCYGGEWFDATSAGNNPRCCGDDGASDDFEKQGPNNPCCINGTKASSDSVISNNYLCLDGQIYTCNLSTPENFDTEIDLWQETGLYCCMPSGWGPAPCPDLSITQIKAEYLKDVDKTRVFVECYRGLLPETNEIIRIDISKWKEENPDFFYGQMLCGETRDFDTSTVVVKNGIYVVHAVFLDTSNCYNCDGNTFFAKGLEIDVPTPELPIVFVIVIGFSVLFLIRKKKK